LSVTLTPNQERALDAIRAWVRDPDAKPFFVMGGFAGTGKSTILDNLVGDFVDLRFCAPTGKAVSVLRSKLPENVQVTTIHSYLYSPREITETDLQRCERDVRELKAQGAPREAVVSAERRLRDVSDMIDRGAVEFDDREGVEQSEFIIVDEASMVNDRMRADLLNAGTKVLFVGDPGQLPPVKGRDFFSDSPPDVMLEEVHRQAADSRILRLATAIRSGEKFDDWGEDCERVDGFPGMEMVIAADQVIAGMNKTRMGFNRAARKHLGASGLYPMNGEPLVCLKNDHIMGFVNGVGGFALSDAEFDTFGDLIVDLAHDGQVVRRVAIDQYHFRRYVENVTRRQVPVTGASQFDFGHCVTCHKAQGSEWDHVVVLDDKMALQDREFRRRWAYTAATRAAKKLTWIVGSGR